MAKTIAISGKGGTGKTTLTALIVRYLVARQQRSVLAVDADANACLGQLLGAEPVGTIAQLRDNVREQKTSPNQSIGKLEAFEYGCHQLVTEATGFDLVAMGRTAQVDVRATLDDGRPATGWWVLPHVNERRWGAHEVTDEEGRARLLLPLPNPGPAQIQVQALPPMTDPLWIWSQEIRENQTVYLLQSFTLEDIARRASMSVVVDDVCEVYINGHHLGSVAHSNCDC